MLDADEALLCYVSDDAAVDNECSATVVANMDTKDVHLVRGLC
jgi:hypothetical protein